jgi:hypothetical protein
MKKYSNRLIGDLTNEREMIECADGTYYEVEETDQFLMNLLVTSAENTHIYVQDMSLNELRTLLAYLMWKDGMPWPDVLTIWDGSDKAFWSREIICNHLKSVFGRE